MLARARVGDDFDNVAEARVRAIVVAMGEYLPGHPFDTLCQGKGLASIEVYGTR